MLQFLTDAPAMWLRQISGLGVRMTYTEADRAHGPLDMRLDVDERDAWSLITGMRDAGFTVEPFARPKQMIADPVFAMAAANVDRERGGSAPAAAWTR
jgi:hypothetical protein